MKTWNEILKDPRIDDSGDYDYLAEELPPDDSRWIKYRCHCESCGKERKLARRDTHYFYCYDGWDSMDYTECWVCVLKNRRARRKRKFKIFWKRVAQMFQLKLSCKSIGWRKAWSVACNIIK